MRLLGVSLSQLAEDAAGSAQLSLFEEAPADDGVESARDRELSRVVDRIRAKFGDGAIVPGAISDA